MTRTQQLAAEFNQRRKPPERDIPALVPPKKRDRTNQVRNYSTLTDHEMQTIITLRKEYLRMQALVNLRVRELRAAHRQWGGPKALANKFNVPVKEISSLISDLTLDDT